MTVTLGLILFLLGLASMTPIVGGGVQHAASAFVIAVGLAERDGLAVVIGAVAGIAAIAVAVLSVASSSKLWRKVKAWLIYCAKSLRLHALTDLLDRCCDGLGDLVRLKWGGLLLLILTPATPLPPRKQNDGSEGHLRKRARRVLLSAARSAPLAKLAPHAT
jgi:Exopolysaccharide synthesis, ExoD